MKKILAMILSVMMLMSFAACGGEQPAKLEGVEAPVDILNTVWESYEEENKFFAMGGDWDTPVDNAPGAVANEEFMISSLVCGGDATAMVESSASLLHAMNANTFTAGAFQLKEGSDKAAFADAMKANLNGNQWMCGFPEKMLIASLTDEYVVVAFGAADLIDTFNTKLTAAFDVTEVLTNEALAV